MKTSLAPFTADLIPQAGILLAERHSRNRKVLPCLPERFESASVAENALQKLWEKGNTRGYAALRNGNLVAYFFGTVTVQAWGRCGWVNLPGHAAVEGESPEILQDLYVLLGEDWIRQGVFIHHTYHSTAEPNLVEAWVDLDFGKERIDAILDLGAVEIPGPALPAGIDIRPAGPGDAGHLAGMSHLIFRELEKAPYWHPTPPEEWEGLRQGWGELADDETVTTWLALEGGKCVGTIASWATTHPEEDTDTDMLAAEDVFTISVAATRPESRGRGIMTALTRKCLVHNRDLGFKFCYTNWISPNLSASRFWPRFGFQEVAYRLTKNVNPMISWTRDLQE